MKRLLVAVSVLAMASGVAACGGDDDDDSTSDSDTPVSSGEGGDIDAGDGGPTRVVPTPGMANVNPVAFDPAEAEATDDGVLIRFYSGVEPCYILDHVEVTDDETSVTVGLFVGADPDQPDAVCIEIAKLYEVDVALDEPLGDRELISATEGRGDAYSVNE